MNTPVAVKINVSDINRAITEDRRRLIDDVESGFHKKIERVVQSVHERPCGTGHKIVMLAGYSAAGKTTTANMIRAKFKEKGVNAHVVSLDNFFLGRGVAPVLPDGSFDYECVDAMNITLLQQCLADLMQKGQTQLPVFDFVSGKQSLNVWPLILEQGDIVIFEGIHALNPLITSHLPEDHIVKIFIHMEHSFYEDKKEILMPRDLRLIRRIVRDNKFRASSAQNTLKMWVQVCRGEEKYIDPYRDRADISIDSGHCYEPCLFTGEITPLLEGFPKDHEYYHYIHNILEQLEKFLPAYEEEVPKTSLLREFIGGSIY